MLRPHHRTRFLRPAPSAAAALAAALVCACGGGGAADEPSGPPPNIVLVALDTLRADHVGCYAYERDTTPAMDAFAQRAFVFDNAQSAAPWTAPALLSLMTSLYPAVHQVTSYPNPGRMSENVTTLAEMLSGAGYETAAFTEGGYAKGDFGLDQGFDHYPRNPGDDESNVSNTEYPSRLSGNLDRTIAWLDAEREKPFFLFFQTYEPHTPYLPGEELIRKFRPDYDEKAHAERAAELIEKWNTTKELTREECLLLAQHRYLPTFHELPRIKDSFNLRRVAREYEVGQESSHKTPEIVQWVTDLYDAEIAYLDRQMDRLWSALEEGGLLDNTIVMIVSDHGEGLGEHQRMEHGRVLYDEILRIVCILRLPPGRYRYEPRRVRELARSVDVMPTLLDLAGVPYQGLELQGRSLRPYLEGEVAELPAFSHARSLVDAEADNLYSICLGKWRMLIDLDTGTRELYDRQADPRELNNVASEHPDIVDRFERMLGRQRSDDGRLREVIATDVQAVELDEELQNELKHLGYTGTDED